LLRSLNRVDRVRGRDLRVALELQQLLLCQPVEIRQRADESELPEAASRLLAHPVDVPWPLHPVDQRLEPARRTRTVGTAVHRLAFRLDDRGAAKWAICRHFEGLRPLRVREDGTDDL